MNSLKYVEKYLNGISIIDASIGEKFWDAFEKDDKQKIDFVLKELEAPFFENCASKFGWHRVNKALLQAAGYMHRRDRMPLKHISDEQYLDVKEIFFQVKRSMALFNSKK